MEHPHPEPARNQSGPAAGFSPYVQEHIGWYVYLLRDSRDGGVFYVGKGTGDRVFQHARDALDLEDGSPTSLKLSRIRDIHRNGGSVQTEILRHGVSSEKAAYEVEAAVIDTLRAIGQPLDNIVLGHRHALNGWASTATVASIYEAEPLPETDEPIVFFKIPNLWTPAMSPADLFEATRGWWKVGERVRRARYALAVHKGVTRAAYRIDYWRERVPADRIPHERGHSESDNHKRLGFWGAEAPEVAHLVNRSIRHLPQPAGSPVIYLNLPERGRPLAPLHRGSAAQGTAATESNPSAVALPEEDQTAPRHQGVAASQQTLLRPLFRFHRVYRGGDRVRPARGDVPMGSRHQSLVRWRRAGLGVRR